jgi:hypothetical protein
VISGARAYLTAKLVAAGIPAKRITDDPERQGKEWPPPQVPFAEVIAEPEQLQRDGRCSAREYDAGTMQATTWKRLVRRTLPVRVRLVHKAEADLDALVTAVLASLDKGYRDGGQTIVVSPAQVVWGQWKDRPGDREQAVIRLEFMGAVYTSSVAPTLQDVNAPQVTVS